MSKRTPPTRITQAELRALRWLLKKAEAGMCSAGYCYSKGSRNCDDMRKKTLRALDKLSGLPTPKGKRP